MRLVFVMACLFRPTASRAETVTLDGKTIADGDSIQVVRGDHVISRMRFRFKDGSSGSPILFACSVRSASDPLLPGQVS